MTAGSIRRPSDRRSDRDREIDSAGLDRDKAALMVLIEQSTKRNEEKFREINVQLEKMDRKIDEHHRETGRAA